MYIRKTVCKYLNIILNKSKLIKKLVKLKIMWYKPTIKLKYLSWYKL